MEVDSLKTAVSKPPVTRFIPPDIKLKSDDIAITQLDDSIEKSNENIWNNKKDLNEDANALLKTAVDNANKVLQATSRRLLYSMHEKTQKVMVSVVNAETNEIIREIPPKNVLDSYAKMLELAGLLVDEKS